MHATTKNGKKEKSLYGGQFTFINSVDKTKFLYITSPPTQHHSFFRNYPFIQKRENVGEFGNYGENDNFATIANQVKHKAESA